MQQWCCGEEVQWYIRRVGCEGAVVMGINGAKLAVFRCMGGGSR